MIFLPSEETGLVGYALILVLATIVVIAIMLLLGPHISNVLRHVNNTLTGG